MRPERAWNNITFVHVYEWKNKDVTWELPNVGTEQVLANESEV